MRCEFLLFLGEKLKGKLIKRRVHETKKINKLPTSILENCKLFLRAILYFLKQRLIDLTVCTIKFESCMKSTNKRTFKMEWSIISTVEDTLDSLVEQFLAVN